MADLVPAGTVEIVSRIERPISSCRMARSSCLQKLGSTGFPAGISVLSGTSFLLLGTLPEFALWIAKHFDKVNWFDWTKSTKIPRNSLLEPARWGT